MSWTLPSNIDPRNRLVRASYYLQMLPEPRSEREAIAAILAIARNALVAFGAPTNVTSRIKGLIFLTLADLAYGWRQDRNLGFHTTPG